MTEIRCPADCPYLASSREHPPAAVVRRQQQDVSWLVRAMRDFNQRQSELFLLVCTLVARHQPGEWQSLVDKDVTEAAEVLASTYETASRGIIYEHRASSATSGRLVTVLKQALDEAGAHGGSAFERDAAVVLRRLVEVAHELHLEAGGTRAFLDLLDRTVRKRDAAPEESPDDAPRLIVP
jgi:hypothetical protein